MSRAEGQASIHCPISLFSRQEGEITRLSQAIKQAPRAPEKAVWAHALVGAVDLLLSCEHYDEGNLNCRLCRQFSELRRKTAALIVKAGQLQEHRHS